MNNHVAKWACLLSFALTLAFFSPQQAAADDNDPPGRVARLSFTRGAVSFEPGGADEWVAARINRPMTTGDRLWTDAGAFAEMNTGSAYLRLGSNTGFSFLNLSDYATQIQLTEGTLLARVRRLDQNETFEIDTPNLAFSLYQPGIYEVTVNQAGDVTVVQVRQGEGEVTGGGASYSLQQGDQGRFAGTDGLVADMSSYRSRSDEFENWSSLRDRRIDHSYSSRYVSPDVIGYEDLDQYGGWRSSGEYGNVWFPHTTEVGWAPYHNGHWAYIAPWGYTWVDDEPWGFAPFHYGRWVNVEGSWGWVPGPRESDYGRGEAYVRPVYAPALVAWVGGAHFSIGVSVGGGGGGRYSEGENVGWFPLGPREVYVPSYPVSRTYVNNVNVSNTNVTNTVVNNYYNTTVVNNTNNSTNVNVTNVKYVNQTVPGAVTATTPQAFVSAQPVAKNVVRVNQQEVAAAPVRIVAPPVAPSREAVLGTTVQAAAKPPEAVVNRTVVAKAAPPPPPVPFVQQQKAIEANGGKPLPVSEIRQMRVQEQQQVQRGQQQQRPQSGQPPQAPPQTQQPAVRIAPPAQPQNARPAQAQANAGNPPAATPNNQQPPNNRPASQNTQQQPPQQQPQPANRPAQPETASPNRPNNPSPLPQQTNRPEQQNNNANRPNIPNNPPNRPPTPTTPDPALEQKHQQELEQLHKQQDLERQRVEQQHQQELKLQEQKAADQQRQQQQQLAQKNAEQQQQQDRKAQLQKIADQQLQQQRQQAQRNADQQQQAQKNAEQQRQQQLQQAQRAADQQRQQLDQKHQQELMQLEQKHAQEQQILNQKHDQEHQQQQQQQQQQRQQPPPPQQQQRPQQPPPQRQPPPPPPPQKDKSKPDRPPQRG